MLSEDDIRDALRSCYDTQNPFGRPVNVVDLGLIESVTLTPDLDAPGAGIAGVPQKQRLLLTLIPSSPGQDDETRDAQTQLTAQIANRLAGLEGLSGTAIRLVTEPVWTASRISSQGRTLLNLDTAHFPIINNR